MFKVSDLWILFFHNFDGVMKLEILNLESILIN